MVHSLGNTDAKGGAKSQMRKHLQHLCKTSVYFHNRKMSKTNENNAQSNTTFREFFIVIIFLNYCFNLHRKPLTVNSNQLHNSSWFHVSGNYFFFFHFLFTPLKFLGRFANSINACYVKLKHRTIFKANMYLFQDNLLKTAPSLDSMFLANYSRQWVHQHRTLQYQFIYQRLQYRRNPWTAELVVQAALP